MRTGTLVLVTWTDAFFELENPTEAPEGYDVTTTGYVVYDGLFLSIAAEQTPDGWRAVTHVPRALVSNVTILTTDL